jgi:glycosyltransferase involved in cell wall biosynthesis
LGLIEALRDDYEIVLLSLLPDDVCRSDLSRVPGVWLQAALPLPVFQPGAAGALADGLHRLPRSIVSTWNPQTATAIVEFARTTGAVIAVGTDLRTLQYLRHLRRNVGGIRTILDEPDVSPFVHAATDGSAISRVRARLRRHKYERLLGEATPDLDAVLVAAENEAQAYRTLSGGHPASIIGNGVRAIPDRPWTPSGTTSLLYTGSVTYGPNLEAVSWYAKSILPLLRTQVPTPILYITGALPEVIPDVLKQPAFRLTGRLDDLDTIYRASAAFVAPILSGTGTRIKILEAMAIGMPVVTTSKGCEGIPLVAGEHALVADTPQAFTLAILRLLNDPDYAAELGRRGRAFVARHGTWQASAERFRGLVAGLLNDAH